MNYSRAIKNCYLNVILTIRRLLKEIVSCKKTLLNESQCLFFLILQKAKFKNALLEWQHTRQALYMEHGDGIATYI